MSDWSAGPSPSVHRMVLRSGRGQTGSPAGPSGPDTADNSPPPVSGPPRRRRTTVNVEIGANAPNAKGTTGSKTVKSGNSRRRTVAAGDSTERRQTRSDKRQTDGGGVVTSGRRRLVMVESKKGGSLDGKEAEDEEEEEVKEKTEEEEDEEEEADDDSPSVDTQVCATSGERRTTGRTGVSVTSTQTWTTPKRTTGRKVTTTESRVVETQTKTALGDTAGRRAIATQPWSTSGNTTGRRALATQPWVASGEMPGRMKAVETPRTRTTFASTAGSSSSSIPPTTPTMMHTPTAGSPSLPHEMEADNIYARHSIRYYTPVATPRRPLHEGRTSASVAGEVKATKLPSAISMELKLASSCKRMTSRAVEATSRLEDTLKNTVSNLCAVRRHHAAQSETRSSASSSSEDGVSSTSLDFPPSSDDYDRDRVTSLDEESSPCVGEDENPRWKDVHRNNLSKSLTTV